MKTTFYRQKWAHMKTQIITPDEFMRLAQQIAYSFMDSYLKDCHYEADFIDLLCEMTAFSEDTNLNGITSQALFSIIIECLCDEFEDLQTETYNRVMAQIISFCRRLRTAEALDRCLQEFGIYTREDLLAFHDKYIHPDRIILGVVGDFDPARMKSLLESAFGDWPRGAAVTEPSVAAPQGPKPSRRYWTANASSATPSSRLTKT